MHLRINYEEEISMQVELANETDQFKAVEKAAQYSRQLAINTGLNCLATDLSINTKTIREKAWEKVRA